MPAILINSAENQVIEVLPVWQKAAASVLICHPHPLFGGTMHNKVVTTLAKTYQALGFNVFTFNFRGVGASSGAFDQGRGELEDALSVMRWAQAQYPVTTWQLAGFSFGAYVACRAAHYLLKNNYLDDDINSAASNHELSPERLDAQAQDLTSIKINRLLLVAPPVHHYDMPCELIPAAIQTQVIVGDADEVVPFAEVQAWCHAHHLPLTVVENGSHFFHGKLSVLKEWVMRTVNT